MSLCQAPTRSGPRSSPVAAGTQIHLVQKPSTLRRKLVKAASPEWLEFYPENQPALNDDIKAKLLKIRPAQIDRLLQPARLSILKKGLSATPPPAPVTSGAQKQRPR